MNKRGLMVLCLLFVSFLSADISAEIIERGANWNKISNPDGSYNLRIYNTIINYNNGTEYFPISYSLCGSNCFRDWNGFIYRVSNDTKKAYINLYDPNNNYISSFGFGITGNVGGVNYTYTTLNFSWIWSQDYNMTTNEYIFRAYNNITIFNWTQEFYFYPNQSMKIKNTVKNNLGVSITNAKFWYIQTVGADDGIWFNGTRYIEDTYKSGEFDSLLSKVKFEDYYVFEYNDLLENGFNITDFYLGDGGVIGVNGIRILAIGITKGNSIFPTGVNVSLDPTIILTGNEGADSYVRGDKPTTNYGSDIKLVVEYDASPQISYLSFNISSIPENQKIDNATFCLYLYKDEGSHNISAHHVYADWIESSITWNNQPCGTNFDNSTNCNLTAESNLSNNGLQDNTWQCWDVKNMVGKEYENNSKKVSIALHTIDIGNADEFYSKEYSNSSLWPYLNLTYSLADIIAPTFSNYTESPINNSAYVSGQTYIFNVTINETNPGSVWIEFNEVNYTSVSNVSNIYSFNRTDLAAETYPYRWWANDTLGNLNNSGIKGYTIEKAGSMIYLYLNHSRSNITIPEETSIAINSTLEGQGNIYVYLNGSLVYQEVPPFYNLTTFFSMGLFNVTAAYLETQNYTSSSETFWVNVIDITPPTINIAFPENGKTYGYNESLPLNYSIFDKNGVDSCWYSVINSTNQIIINNTLNCQNTTFNVPRDDSYILILYSNDSVGNLAEKNISFSVITNAPAINLVYPKNNSFLSYKNNVYFNYSAVSGIGISSCQLWLNANGTWQLNQTNNNPNNGDNFFLLNLSDGDYAWGIICNDSQNRFNNKNYTFAIDTVPPSVSLSQPTGAKTSRTISAGWSVSDANLNTCWYNVYRGASLELANTSVNCSANTTNFEVTVDANFVFDFYANDSAGNINFSSSSFSVDTSTPVNPPSGGGGGGGGGSVSNITVKKDYNLELNIFPNLIVDPGESKKIILSAQNVGKNFLNDCKIKGKGENAAWISSEGSKGLSIGEKKDFIFTLKVPEWLKSGSYILELSLMCQEHNKSTSFTAEIIEKKLGVELIKTIRENEDKVKIVYALSELSGTDQEVEVEIILFGEGDERLVEIKERRYVDANSRKEFETILNIPELLEGNFNLLINGVSQISSTFVQEEIVLGISRVGGLAIFDRVGETDTLFSIILAALFIIFSIFILRRIFKLRKLKKIKTAGNKRAVMIIDGKIVEKLKRQLNGKNHKGKWIHVKK